MPIRWSVGASHGHLAVAPPHLHACLPACAQVTILGNRLPLPPKCVPGATPERWPKKIARIISRAWDG